MKEIQFTEITEVKLPAFVDRQFDEDFPPIVRTKI